MRSLATPPAAARTTLARIAVRCSVVPALASASSARRSASSIGSGAAGRFGMSGIVAAPGGTV